MSTNIPQVPIGIKPPSSVTWTTLQSLSNADRFLVTNYTDLKFDKVLLPVTNLRYRDRCKRQFQEFVMEYEGVRGADYDDDIMSNLAVSAPDLDEVNIHQGDHTQNVIGLISSCIELDTSDQLINEFSLQVLEHELSYASFLGLSTILLAPPKILDNLSIFTNSLNRALQKFPNLTISISLPICEENMVDPVTGECYPVIDSLSTWDMWNSIRLQCNYHANLTVSLALPKNSIPHHVIQRWCLEPLSIILISNATFVKNSKNFPVLNKFNQVILWKLIQKHWFAPPVLLIHGNIPASAQESDDMIKVRIPNTTIDCPLVDVSYSNYLRFISQTTDKNLQISSLELVSTKFFGTRRDTLQAPLQPLYHDLDNKTYKVFESDITKYDSYELAITKAIRSLAHRKRDINLLVVGAGRGPLVERAIAAAQKSNTPAKCKITAVEKNSSVFVSLQKLNREYWNSEVDLVFTDARSFSSPTKFDVVISELLGSLGDNELFPECIYPVQASCAEDCVYIPSKVSTFIAPAVAPQIHQQLIQKLSTSSAASSHKPYLVLLNQFQILSSRCQELWSFEFPSQRTPSKKFGKLTFKCHHKGLIHGIVGYFVAELFDGVMISNNPQQPEPADLISWLPMFFPLESPIFLSDDQEVEIFMRRDRDAHKVWYEWCVESFIYLLLPPSKKGSQIQQQQRNGPGPLHNSVFGGVMAEANNENLLQSPGRTQEEYQVRVRTGVSQVHNANGSMDSIRL